MLFSFSHWGHFDPTKLLFAGHLPFSIPSPHHPPNSLPRAPESSRLHFTSTGAQSSHSSCNPTSTLANSKPQGLSQINTGPPLSEDLLHCQAPNLWTQPTFLRSWNSERPPLPHPQTHLAHCSCSSPASPLLSTDPAIV